MDHESPVIPMRYKIIWIKPEFELQDTSDLMFYVSTEHRSRPLLIFGGACLLGWSHRDAADHQGCCGYRVPHCHSRPVMTEPTESQGNQLLCSISSKLNCKSSNFCSGLRNYCPDFLGPPDHYNHRTSAHED